VTAPLIVGIIILTGFVLGELANKIRLPKVVGYVLAGLLLNPDLFHFIPPDFVDAADPVTAIALSFITFLIGGTLFFPRIKKLGKSILYITFFEAEFTFLAIVLGFLAIAPFFVHIPHAGWFTVFIPLSILLGSVGCPTDPAATLAVIDEYKAKGRVTSTVLSAAAFDDALGLMTFSVAIVIASIFASGTTTGFRSAIISPLAIIAGSLVLGVVFGFTFNLISTFERKEHIKEADGLSGILIVVIFGLLPMCFGVASFFKLDSLLATMTMGAFVVNYHHRKDQIFITLQRYAEGLIFVLFFTLSGMHLKLSVVKTYYMLIVFFILFRAIGKILGTVTGGLLSKSPREVTKYAAGGLLPYGGIVIGLALVIKQNPAFADIADIILSVVIGATIFYEITGAIFAKIALKKAGEID